MMDKIFIGPLPPPIGGVSNHLLRYSNERGVDVVDEKFIRTWKNSLRIFTLRHKNIYLHSASWYPILLLLIKSYLFNNNCTYSIVNHNFSSLSSFENRNLKRKLSHYIRKRFIKRCANVLVVNQKLMQKMEKIYGQHNYSLFDPFVAPQEQDESRVLESYDKTLFQFLNNHSPIICSGAWKLVFYNGEDLYGLDLLIELISAIQFEIPNVGLIFFIGDPSFNADYLLKCERIIKKLALTDKVFFVKGQKEMWPVIKRSDLFIRATNTDGDPLTIKESLCFNTKVLASDCVKRPNTVSVYQSRNLQSLIEKTLRALKAIN